MTLEKRMEKRQISMTRNRRPLAPPFPWVGGKRKEIKHLEPMFPAYKTYSEPFVGAGAVYWHERPDKAVINDYNPDVTVFYKEIKRGDLDKIHNKLDRQRNHIDKKHYDNMKYSNPKTDLDKAYKFYYMRKTTWSANVDYKKDGSVSGSFGKVPGGNSINKRDSPEDYEKTMKGTRVMTGDFEKAARAADSPSTFHFFDPPYDSADDNYTGESFGRENHRRLAKLFYSLKGKAMITVNDTPFIRSLYKKKDIKKVYNVQMRKGNRKDANYHAMRTLVICNYDIK